MDASHGWPRFLQRQKTFLPLPAVIAYGLISFLSKSHSSRNSGRVSASEPFSPLYFGHLEKKIRLGVITALGNKVFDDGDRELALEFVSIMGKHDKVRYIASAIIALVVFFLVRVSSIGEFISIAICVFGPLPVGMLRMGSMMKRRELDPELFDAVQELYLSFRQILA